MNKVEKGVRGTRKVGKHSPTVNTNSCFVQNLIMTYADPCLSAIMNDRFRQKNARVVAQRDWGQRTKINRTINITLPSTPTSYVFPLKCSVYLISLMSSTWPANLIFISPLTPCNIVLFKKQTVALPLKKFFAFYETRRLIPRSKEPTMDPIMGPTNEVHEITPCYLQGSSLI
jgi:hypothetical protein